MMQMSRFFQKCITDDYMVHKGAKMFMKRMCITFDHGKNKLSSINSYFIYPLLICHLRELKILKSPFYPQ